MQPPPRRAAASVSASYLELQKAAETLNDVSDAFSRAVVEIDVSLRKLNLGVIAWVMVEETGGHSENPVYEISEIGYTKINGKWGIALRQRRGNVQFPEDDREEIEIWAFNEAARNLRIKAIGRLPHLLRQMSEQAANMTRELQESLADTQEIVEALNPSKSKGLSIPRTTHSISSALQTAQELITAGSQASPTTVAALNRSLSESANLSAMLAAKSAVKK